MEEDLRGQLDSRTKLEQWFSTQSVHQNYWGEEYQTPKLGFSSRNSDLFDVGWAPGVRIFKKPQVIPTETHRVWNHFIMQLKKGMPWEIKLLPKVTELIWTPTLFLSQSYIMFILLYFIN